MVSGELLLDMTGFRSLVIKGLRQLGRRVDQLRLERRSRLLLMGSLGLVRARGIDGVNLRVARDRELTELVNSVYTRLHEVSIRV